MIIPGCIKGEHTTQPNANCSLGDPAGMGKGAINSGDFDSLKYLVIKYVLFSVENILNILKFCTIPRKLLLMVNPSDGFFRGRSKEKRILKMCVFASFSYKKSSDVFQRCCNK